MTRLRGAFWGQKGWPVRDFPATFLRVCGPDGGPQCGPAPAPVFPR